METIRSRELDADLNKRFPYVPRSGVVDAPDGHFEEALGWVSAPPSTKFEEDLANRIEALKVKVWRDGGPQKVNESFHDNGSRATAIEVCEVGSCLQYLPRTLKACYRCGIKACSIHREFLLGEWTCPQCAMVLRNF